MPTLTPTLSTPSTSPAPEWEPVDGITDAWAVACRAKIVLDFWESWLGESDTRDHFAIHEDPAEIAALFRQFQADHPGWGKGRDLDHDARVVWSWLTFPEA